MRNPRFVHVGISYPLQVNATLVDEAIASESFDWMRYSWFCYVLWTSSDCETIVRKILRVPGLENSHCLAFVMDITDGYGNLPGWVWDWIKLDRGYGSVKIWTPPDVVQPQPQLPLLPFLPPLLKR